MKGNLKLDWLEEFRKIDRLASNQESWCGNLQKRAAVKTKNVLP